MKRLFIEYYKYRIHKLVVAQADLMRHVCLRGHYQTCRYLGLTLAWKRQELYLEFYKGLLPKKWRKECESL